MCMHSVRNISLVTFYPTLHCKWWSSTIATAAAAVVSVSMLVKLHVHASGILPWYNWLLLLLCSVRCSVFACSHATSIIIALFTMVALSELSFDTANTYMKNCYIASALRLSDPCVSAMTSRSSSLDCTQMSRNLQCNQNYKNKKTPSEHMCVHNVYMISERSRDGS